MGKKGGDTKIESVNPYAVTEADFAANNLNQFTPLGNMIYTAPQFIRNAQGEATGVVPGSQGTAQLILDPAIQNLFNMQAQIDTQTLGQSIVAQQALNQFVGQPLPGIGGLYNTDPSASPIPIPTGPTTGTPSPGKGQLPSPLPGKGVFQPSPSPQPGYQPPATQPPDRYGQQNYQMPGANNTVWSWEDLGDGAFGWAQRAGAPTQQQQSFDAVGQAAVQNMQPGQEVVLPGGGVVGYNDRAAYLGGGRSNQYQSMQSPNQVSTPSSQQNFLDPQRPAQYSQFRQVPYTPTPGQTNLAGQLRNVSGIVDQGVRNFTRDKIGPLPGITTDIDSGRNTIDEVRFNTFDQNMRLLRPEFQRREQELRQRLENQGIPTGAEAASGTGEGESLGALSVFERERNRAINDAAQQAIISGSGEQSRLLAEERANRGLFFGEGLDRTNLARQGTAGLFGLTNQANQAVQGLNLLEGQRLMDRAQFGREGAAGQLGIDQGLAQWQAQNRLTDVQLQNAARAGQFNELAALLGLQQVAQPGLQNFYAPSGANVTGAFGLANQANIAQAQLNQQQDSALMQGLFNLGAAGIGNLNFGPFGSSDVRLKKNIRWNGEEYEWEWNEEAKRIGADVYPTHGELAQEVMLTEPERVIVGPHGYLMVRRAA